MAQQTSLCPKCGAPVRKLVSPQGIEILVDDDGEVAAVFGRARVHARSCKPVKEAQRA